MDEPRLSQRERRILAEMERDLRADMSDASPEDGSRRRRRLGGGGRPSGRPGHGHALAVVVALLGVLSLGLLVLAVATGEPALVWVFAVTWVLTVTGLLRLVIRWSRHLRPRSWPN
ncbi:hypothetical protein ACF09C_01990 [Streptomyces sp. NPDC014870]|uniref:hypothetical protein n=1 Tax=Streptomyces sp. NPDC014870 TaxID=3364925 RepID=UPI0036FE14F8